MIRRLLAALALLVGSATVLTAGTDFAAAKAYAAPRCTATTGVVVAVDFSAWDGPTVRACASTPTTGLQALHQGGFSTTGTAHDGPGYICRIASGSFRGGSALPSTAQQACVRTPPSSAYWSYWHAGRSQSSWHYSSLGAAGYSPAPGSVDAWTFGAGTPPNVAPAALRATGGAAPTRSSKVSAPTSRPASSPRTTSVPRPTSIPRTTTPQPTAPVATIRLQPRPGRRSGVPPRRTARTDQADPSPNATPRTTAPADPGSPSSSSAPPSPTARTSSVPLQTSATSAERTSPSRGTKPGSASRTTGGPTRPSAITSTAPQKSGSASIPTTTEATPSASPTASPSTPTVIDATSAAPAPHSGSSPWPAVLGGALVLLLAAGAALTFWRRRRLG